MKKSIFIPKTLKVGFVKRGDTYNGKLAYVTYIDEKGVTRKEISWEGWRDKSISPEEYSNEPTSGFVLNKKVGGYSSGWDHRQTYTRIYDPRGFEFEITIPNLLYILENTSSIKGKGLEGDFVYGWDGKDLILIPTGSPDYIELMAFSDQINSKTKIKAKELVLGGVYKTKKNEDLVYMGQFEEWCPYYHKSKGKKHFFADSRGRYSTYSSLTTLIGVVSDVPVGNYADLMDKLERNEIYSPVDKSKVEYPEVTANELLELLTLGNDYVYFTYGLEEVYGYLGLAQEEENKIDWEALPDDFDETSLYDLNKHFEMHWAYKVKTNSRFGDSVNIKMKGTLPELCEKYKFKIKQEYLKNGNKKR